MGKTFVDQSLRSLSVVRDSLRDEKQKKNIKALTTTKLDLLKMKQFVEMSRRETVKKEQLRPAALASDVRKFIDKLEKALPPKDEDYETILAEEHEHFKQRCLSEFKDVEKQIHDHSKVVETFSGSRSHKQYLHVQEMLEKLVHRLDKMQNLRNDAFLKAERKKLIGAVYKLETKLENKVVWKINLIIKVVCIHVVIIHNMYTSHWNIVCFRMRFCTCL